MNDEKRAKLGWMLLLSSLIYILGVFIMRYISARFKETYDPIFVSVIAILLLFLGLYFIRIKKEKGDEINADKGV